MTPCAETVMKQATAVVVVCLSASRRGKRTPRSQQRWACGSSFASPRTRGEPKHSGHRRRLRRQQSYAGESQIILLKPRTLLVIVGHGGRSRKQRCVRVARVLRPFLKHALDDATDKPQVSLSFPRNGNAHFGAGRPHVLLSHLRIAPSPFVPIERQVSSSEAVTEALRSTLRSPRFASPLSSISAPISSTPRPEDPSALPFDAARQSRVGSDSDKEALLGASSDGHARGRSHVVSESNLLQQGRAGAEAEVRRRERDQGKPPSPLEAGVPGGIGGVGEDKTERALPMLWPPPKSCVVVRDEVCRVPPQVVVS